MNVIVANKYKEMITSLNLETIKFMDGVFSVDELISTFENFFFNRMILDITSIDNYQDLTNLQRLSINLDMSKVILVLDDTPESDTKGYLSKLISMGIYNFTKNLAGVSYLMQHPNSYRDVAHLHNLKDQQEPGVQTQTEYIQGDTVYVGSPKLRVIGVKSITMHAGATTLTYLLKKHLDDNYKTVAIEVNRNDFMFLPKADGFVSTTSDDLPKEVLKHQNCEIAIVDLNNYEDDGICTEVLYLIEPSTIMLNRLTRTKLHIFEKLKNKKIVLTKSMLTSGEVPEFEYESKANVYFNLPPIDDRDKNIESISDLIKKMGFIKDNNVDF